MYFEHITLYGMLYCFILVANLFFISPIQVLVVVIVLWLTGHLSVSLLDNAITSEEIFPFPV